METAGNSYQGDSMSEAQELYANEQAHNASS
jgi:hypothetical protein